MTVCIRALLAALVVLVIAATAAFALAYRVHRSSVGSELQVASTNGLRGLFQPVSTGGPQLVDLALQKLETVYYKPIAPQTPLAGEESALQGLLRAKKIAASLPPETASGIGVIDGSRAADLLASAERQYAGKLGTDGRADLTDAALRGMMNSVKDPYTVYLSPREIAGLDESLSGGNFGGIGVYIYQLKDGNVIVQPIEQMPAARSGMKPGEIVDTVNGKRIKGIVLDRVEQMIRGEPGTVVRLTTHPYNHPKQEHSYAIVRQTIHVPTVRAKMENGIDYIRLSDFGETSAAEIRKALLAGRTHDAKGYILDLRDNGGGLLEAAVQISSFFVPHGTIVSTIKRDGTTTSEEATGTAIGGLHPLVILVNKYTASASEITAGALQDYHLATLVGTRTFGKGVVQSIYPLPDASAKDGALKITTARYVTPAGRDIQHKGIEPDVVVNQNPDPSIIDTPADKQLAAAKARLLASTR